MEKPRPYMSRAELFAFQKARKEGQITFFRTGLCKNCKVEIAKGRGYCSMACYNVAVQGILAQEDSNDE